eukprot:3507153-Pyramimonas_sp.AAC.2
MLWYEIACTMHLKWCNDFLGFDSLCACSLSPLDAPVVRAAQCHVVFAVEHRYYGESIPTPDLSTSSLQWLSSRQALEDLSLFIVAMNKEYNLTSLNPWVSWGGRSSTLKP